MIVGLLCTVTLLFAVSKAFFIHYVLVTFIHSLLHVQGVKRKAISLSSVVPIKIVKVKDSGTKMVHYKCDQIVKNLLAS